MTTTSLSSCHHALRTVIRRCEIAAFGTRCVALAQIVAALYIVEVLLGRVGLIEPVPCWGFAALIGIGISLAWVMRPRTSPGQAALLIDAHAGTQDLWVTATELNAAGEHPAGRYGPLVSEAARECVASLRPDQVVRWDWQSGCVRAGGVCVIGLMAFLWLPNGDPFGLSEQRQEAQERQARLDEQAKKTAERKRALKKRGLETKRSKKVEAELKALKRTLAQMKRDQQRKNQAQLNQKQMSLGNRWRSLQNSSLAQSRRGSHKQRIGGRNIQDVRNALARGDSKEARKLLADLKKKLEAMQSKDPAEKQKARSELARALGQMNRAMGQFDPGLRAALERALEQLQAGEDSELAESLDLAGLEFDQLAQQIRDMEGLEQALEALQLAKNLNQTDPLDGSACESCESMADYAELYEKMMAARGDKCSECQGAGCSSCNGTGAGTVPGAGMRGAGTGQGGLAGEDGAKNDFEAKRSRSARTAGKTLMQMGSRSAAGPAADPVQYREQVKQVQQAASEAIKQESVPPSYHSAIQRYFERLGPKK